MTVCSCRLNATFVAINQLARLQSFPDMGIVGNRTVGFDAHWRIATYKEIRYAEGIPTYDFGYYLHLSIAVGYRGCEEDAA